MSEPTASVCLHPLATPLTAYGMGCRCERCVTAKREAWRADNAKRPDRDRAEHGICPVCGGPKVADRQGRLCRHCARDRDRAPRAERCQQITAWWVEGLSMDEIASRLGWTKGTLGSEMDWMRKNGYSLSHRYKTYAGEARV